MSRIKACFARLEGEGRKALIPYITAGDPQKDYTVNLMLEMAAAGADVIELGVPFSDPGADGPVIQAAHERGVSQGVTLADVLAMVSEFRKTDNDTPVALMTYLNPVEIMGYEQFAQAAAEAGVDGLLVVDSPPEHSAELLKALGRHELDAIYLLAPTTPDERIRHICEAASGYVYYVSLKGVTGAATLDVDGVRERVAHIKTMTKLPVCVGFGIHNGDTAAAISQVADGVIVGTALVKKLTAEATPALGGKAVKQQLAEMRSRMDAC
ncbi:MAG: tryptophan synthase subunit alpha [Oceanospirillales bacterium LUC14_002_19_P2]|nr:MAG: tryptophan synthase subunit alpha [Oceanospirillales bacterium LUC14_002_19_P2]